MMHIVGPGKTADASTEPSLLLRQPNEEQRPKRAFTPWREQGKLTANRDVLSGDE
jgi:hypothetical protein